MRLMIGVDGERGRIMEISAFIATDDDDIYVHTCTYAHARVHTRKYTHVYIKREKYFTSNQLHLFYVSYLYIYIYVCVCVCVLVCMFMYIYM